jgi:hypothetical protein
MSYEAIIPSQDVFITMDLNGDFTSIGQPVTGVSGLTAETITPSIHAFVNDHPFDNTKQSFRVTGFSGGGDIRTSQTRNYYSFNQDNISLTGGGRNTFEFWFKYTTLNNRVPQFANNGVIASIFTNDSTAERQAIEVRLNGGGTFGVGNAGLLSMAFITSGSTIVSQMGAHYYSPNVWHCVHIEFQRDNSTLKNRPYLYVNGRLDNCASSSLSTQSDYSNGLSSIRIGPPTNQLSSTLTDGTQLFLAEATYFRRNLTNKEKMLRAQYGRMTTAGLRNEILADNPKIYLPLDNETLHPVEQAGDPTWGTELLSTWSTGQTTGRAVYGAGVFINQTGDRGKSWSFPASSGTANTVTVGGNTSAKMKELLHDRTKSISLEWFTLNPTYDSAVASNGSANLINIGRRAGTAATSGIGGFAINTGTNNGSASSTAFIGRNIPNVDFWTGSAWSSGNVNTNFGADVSGNSQWNFANYADNQWHHHVLTLSRTTNGIFGRYYFDGFLHVFRDFGTASNSQAFVDATNWATNLDRFTFGPYTQPSTAYNRRFTLDNVAIYDYELSAQIIRQQYYAFSAQDPVPGTRIVRHWTGTEWVDSLDQKVWNGTAWVDWDAKRWNGTSWIAA